MVRQRNLEAIVRRQNERLKDFTHRLRKCYNQKEGHANDLGVGLPDGTDIRDENATTTGASSPAAANKEIYSLQNRLLERRNSLSAIEHAYTEPKPLYKNPARGTRSMADMGTTGAGIKEGRDTELGVRPAHTRLAKIHSDDEAIELLFDRGANIIPWGEEGDDKRLKSKGKGRDVSELAPVAVERADEDEEQIKHLASEQYTARALSQVEAGTAENSATSNPLSLNPVLDVEKAFARGCARAFKGGMATAKETEAEEAAAAEGATRDRKASKTKNWGRGVFGSKKGPRPS